MDIKYVSVTEASAVFTKPIHIIGFEITGDSRFSFYDAAAASSDATLLCDTLRGTSYWKNANIVFPIPGLKLNNGLYISGGFDEGLVTVYYHEGKDSLKDILWQPISEAGVQISTGPCELIGMDTWSSGFAAYDEADESETAANKVMQLMTGSYFFYEAVILPEPLVCNNGLYINDTGKGTVFYRK